VGRNHRHPLDRTYLPVATLAFFTLSVGGESSMLKLYVKAKDKLAAASKFFTKQQEGASLVEYGLLVGLIACVCIAAITAVGLDISNLFGRIANKLNTVGT
jgi:pilus assembly protein Flp/PilA